MFHYFTIKFHFSFFASFCFFSLQIFRFASLWQFLLRSETKRSEIQVYFLAFFHFFSLFFAFFAFFWFFRFNFFASLRFSDFCFEAKRNSSLQYFFAFFTFFRFFSLFFSFFFRFFSLFSLNFCFTSIFSLNFRLFYLHFRFRFLVFHIEVNHVKSGFFSLPSEMKFSLQFKISLRKRK